MHIADGLMIGGGLQSSRAIALSFFYFQRIPAASCDFEDQKGQDERWAATLASRSWKTTWEN
jgi:hypothetical protein